MTGINILDQKTFSLHAFMSLDTAQQLTQLDAVITAKARRQNLSGYGPALSNLWMALFKPTYYQAKYKTSYEQNALVERLPPLIGLVHADDLEKVFLAATAPVVKSGGARRHMVAALLQRKRRKDSQCQVALDWMRWKHANVFTNLLLTWADADFEVSNTVAVHLAESLPCIPDEDSRFLLIQKLAEHPDPFVRAAVRPHLEAMVILPLDQQEGLHARLCDSLYEDTAAAVAGLRIRRADYLEEPILNRRTARSILWQRFRENDDYGDDKINPKKSSYAPRRKAKRQAGAALGTRW